MLPRGEVVGLIAASTSMLAKAVSSILGWSVNHSLRTLSATASSVINNVIVLQIAVLAWLFLGERLTWTESAGIVLAVAGTSMIILVRAQPGADRSE